MSGKLRVNERNSSIEALRIITMLGVVILHYNNANIGGGLKYVADGSLNQYYLYLIECVFVCAVDLYVLISAYFLSNTQRRSFVKIVELVLQVIAFNVAFYLARVAAGEVFSLKSLLYACVPANYFVILYSALYIVSPYINVCLKKLNKRDFKHLLITVVLLFSVWTILVDYIENIFDTEVAGLSTIGLKGSQSGYTIVNFVIIYIAGGGT